MNAKVRKRIRRVSITFLLIYLIGGGLLFLGQDLLLFHPTSLSKDHRFQFDQPFEEVNLSFEGDNLSIVKFPVKQQRKGLVLFFHGNMNNVEHYKKYPRFFTDKGYDIWMIDYPGFGKTTGRRTEEKMYAQALLMYRLAAQSISADSIIIYGKSIGTGVAAYLASAKPCRQLVLETPYYSIDALARHYFPIYPLMPMTRYGFPTYQYLQQVKVPVTIMHGTADEVIPFRQAQKLRQENPGLSLIAIEGGHHNDLSDFPLFQSTLDSFLR